MPESQTDQAKETPEADEHGHEWGSDVERVEHGYAPLMDPSSLLSREEREAAAREELGTPPAPEAEVLLQTDEEVAKRVERLRAGRPAAVAADAKSVIINGIAMLLPAGPDAEKATIPAEAKAVLENAATALRTGQMKGLGNGLRTYDLTRDAAANPSGTPSEAIKASAEATTAEAETERREASAGRPAARASKA